MLWVSNKFIYLTAFSPLVVQFDYENGKLQYLLSFTIGDIVESEKSINAAFCQLEVLCELK